MERYVTQSKSRVKGKGNVFKCAGMENYASELIEKDDSIYTEQAPALLLNAPLFAPELFSKIRVLLLWMKWAWTPVQE